MVWESGLGAKPPNVSSIYLKGNMDPGHWACRCLPEHGFPARDMGLHAPGSPLTLSRDPFWSFRFPVDLTGGRKRDGDGFDGLPRTT